MDIIFVYMNLDFSSPSPSVQYHVDHNRVHFYVDDASTATALHKCSHKITDTDGYKVCCVNLILISAESLLSLMISLLVYHRVGREKKKINACIMMQKWS